MDSETFRDPEMETDTENFRRTRYSETDVKPRICQGDRWTNVSCPAGLPDQWGSQNKNSYNSGWQEQSQKNHQSRMLGSTQP